MTTDLALAVPKDTSHLFGLTPSEESSAGVAGHGPVVEVGGGRGSADPAGVLQQPGTGDIGGGGGGDGIGIALRVRHG